MFWASSAAAQASGTDRALAEQLFQSAQDLMRSERYAEACPKFAESQRLDPGTGTLLNLALCHEREGKLASAWTEYNDVITFAQRDQRPDRVQFAKERIAAIEPKLSRLTLQVAPDADVPGLEIQLDGQTLGAAARGVATPADPGEHVVSAKAPGKLPWQSKLQLAANAATQTVTVPKLVDAPPGEAKPPTEAAAGHTGQTQRVSGFALGGFGALGIGVGSYFGLRAISKNNQSNDEGCSGNMCPPAAAATRRSAQSAGTVSTVAFIVGGAALAAGVVLVLSAPRGESEAKPQVALNLGPGSAQLQVQSSW
ncbi:MAG: hypothetical protein QM756_33980 [Polyangiaceae bacterium]